MSELAAPRTRLRGLNAVMSLEIALAADVLWSEPKMPCSRYTEPGDRTTATGTSSIHPRVTSLPTEIPFTR